MRGYACKGRGGGSAKGDASLRGFWALSGVSCVCWISFSVDEEWKPRIGWR